jgi:hypothetical protein
MPTMGQVSRVVTYLAAIILGLLLGLSPCHPSSDLLGWSSVVAFGVMVATSLLSGREKDEQASDDTEETPPFK